MLDQISTAVSVAASQVASTTSYPVGGFQPFLAGGASNNTLSDVAEAEAELSAFEDKEAEPFVKSICDLFLETFELNKGSGSNWLRGRAVVVVLHQLLGGTIEKYVSIRRKVIYYIVFRP